MKRMVLLLALLGARVAVGCSDDDDGGAPDQGDAATPNDGAAAMDAATAEDAADAFVIPDGSPPCNDGGWCRTEIPGIPTPQLNAVHAVSPTRALAAGEACVIQANQYLCESSLLLWDGTKWTAVARGLPKITAIWSSDADHFWVVDETDRSLYRVTFTGDDATLSPEPLPVDLSTCADTKLAISGSSDANLYVSAYCYNGDQTTKGYLFRHTTTWSTIWTSGGNATSQAALGAVYVDGTSGKAFAAGWRIHAPMGTYGARYLVPDMNTLVLRVDGTVVQEEELAPALTTCPQSIWAASDGNLFVGGVCDSGYTDFTKVPTLLRTGAGEGGVGWGAFYQTSIGQYGAIGSSFPLLWGFANNDVYATGSWAQIWNGTALQTVSLVVNGAPVASRVTSVHGSAPNDVWVVGSSFAIHRSAP